VRHGTVRGRQRWLCRACRRTFGPTTGTPLAGLKTDLAEGARALRAVRRRGSRRAAAEQTGHPDETLGRWLRRAGEHAARLTEALVEALHLSEVQGDEFGSFVRNKGARGRTRARAGAACA
jgi:transposase-like protein